MESLIAGKGEAESYGALSYRGGQRHDCLGGYRESHLQCDLCVPDFAFACIVVDQHHADDRSGKGPQEIGTMSALGVERERHCAALFLVEGGIMGIVGSFIGALLGGASNAYLAQAGLDFTADLRRSQCRGPLLTPWSIQNLPGLMQYLPSYWGVVIVTLFLPNTSPESCQPKSRRLCGMLEGCLVC